MKIKLLKDKGRMGKKGESVEVRSEEQAQAFVDAGDAEIDETPEETTPEKELVLLNPEPGTYTTALVDKKPTEETEETKEVAVADRETGKTVKEKVSTGKKKK
jgi:hypothetical protein